MAGQLASLPLSIQLNDNARPYDGALLYIYNAGTSTPAIFYEDFATTITLSWPLVADASGRIPMFWVADGSYRVRLTDNAGNEIFDINSITAVGPSSGTGGGSTVGSDQIFSTGDMIFAPVSGLRSGWVRGNARTIGSSSSGASERANADCQSLFEWFWTNFSDTLCPVSTGRGGTALADWTANKTIGTLDMRGRGIYGLDDMGNSAASVIAAATSAAGALGAENQTVLVANLPSTNLNTSGLSVGTTINNGTLVTRALSVTTNNNSAGGGANAIVNSATFSSVTVSLASGALSGTLPLGGSATPLATLSPGRAGSWFFKL